MKKLLKVVLPPCVGFGLYFICVRYSSVYFDLNIGEIGTGTLNGFMAFYKFSLPLLFVIALLTQLLIINPIWNAAIKRSKAGKMWTMGIVFFVCLLLAGAISYVIWDHATGTRHLILNFLFMSGIQIFYWLINFGVLSILDRSMFVTQPASRKD
ncbi:MAG: hypothetical protein JWP44_566 [Mucilaginibacter sp.]|nr:hypothetical protein [Mucilaginibacter sp.]